jgi:3-hydroxymyristoyl/3-hydroxydecanoyl-(acyl carrier protein) dehydratase
MNEHFAAFSFVDRIATLEPGVRARGTFAVPGDLTLFPACLVAEAVGQLAAWVAMARNEFRGRPVAALATETIFHGEVAPGSRLDLAVEVESCDDDAIAYGGVAHVDGEKVIELRHCLGPMLPVQEFDAPEELRERFRLLCAEGAPGGRFRGVAAPALSALTGEAGRSASATLQVPTSAPFFADHFPRRPVFPATLLLDSQNPPALDLARAAIGPAANAALVPERM